MRRHTRPTGAVRIRHRLSENACNTHILCPDSSLYPVLCYFSIPDRFLPPFENDRQVFNTIPKHNSPLPSFLSGQQNRNDDKRKEYNMTLSEESGIGYRKTRIYKTIKPDCFFLSVSFPRIRWQANCVFRSVAMRKRNETLCLWLGSAELARR